MENKPYHIIPSDGYLVVKLIGSCEFNSAKIFSSEVLELLEKEPLHLIFNCEHLQSLSKDWIREMMSFQNLIKDHDKKMRLILVRPEMKKDLKGLGLDTTFKTSTTIKEALTELGLVKKNMLDTEFLNPFLTATLHVLKVQANVEAVNDKIFAKKPGDKFVGDISGIIGIISETFNGSVVISFPEKTFLKVMSGMLGEEFTEMNSELLDGAGEITNMIFGQAKIVLNEKGYGIKTALPSVVSGKDHSMSTLTKGIIVVVPFKSSAGDFFVEICMAP